VAVDTAVASADRQGDDPDPAVWLERLERRQGLQAALAGLSFEQREVLSLRFGQELSVEETAAVVGVPAGTVKSRVFTALRRLRGLLEERATLVSDEQGDHVNG
jgi:RNA polymerase sigma-70 factor (ECF subfamily)